MVQNINSALVQAKVQHPNVCEILEVQMEIDRENCTIYHVLEDMEGNLEQDIEQRKQRNRPYGEADLQTVLMQTANALAYAHSTAHRDLKPGSIFSTGDTYKVADFESFMHQWKV